MTGYRRSHKTPPAIGRHPTEWWVYVPHVSRQPRSADGTGTIYGPFTGLQTAQAFTDKQPAGSFVMGPFVASRPQDKRKGDKVKVVRREPGQVEKEAGEEREKIAFWLKELENPVGQLTAWELQFVESVADQFGSRGTLTSKQVEVLARIHEEKAG